jgi:hypothetical protein
MGFLWPVERAATWIRGCAGQGNTRWDDARGIREQLWRRDGHVEGHGITGPNLSMVCLGRHEAIIGIFLLSV